MEEDVFYHELHLHLGPTGVLMAQGCRLEFTRGPIQREGHPQLLSPSRAAKRGDVFRRQFGSHGRKVQDQVRFDKGNVAKSASLTLGQAGSEAVLPPWQRLAGPAPRVPAGGPPSAR